MNFVHDEPEFSNLLEIVARETGIAAALVEKDYWVTHTLWGLHQLGLAVWFKGGTSLSKGFGIIQRFSEDLDLMIEQGIAVGLPEVINWGSMNKGPVASRKAFYSALEQVLHIADMQIERTDFVDPKARSAEYRGTYPGMLLDGLSPAMRPYVLLEVGHARVVPHVERPITSFIHEHLVETGMLDGYRDNHPRAVRCVHPLLTLFEKLDAMDRRYAREPMEADAFVRHYEDAAHIIRAMGDLPPLKTTPPELGNDLLRGNVIRALPDVDAPALALTPPEKRRAVERAYTKIAPMYWGTRLTLDEACEVIRGWVQRQGW